MSHLITYFKAVGPQIECFDMNIKQQQTYQLPLYGQVLVLVLDKVGSTADRS